MEMNKIITPKLAIERVLKQKTLSFSLTPYDNKMAIIVNTLRKIYVLPHRNSTTH